MTTAFRALTCSVAAACLLAITAAPVNAKGRPKGAALRDSPKVLYSSGQSGDSRQKSEDARLRRECKGRPNAGACLGYTR